MADHRSWKIRAKKELVTKEEKTVPARSYVPSTDIYETQDALTVVMEMRRGKEDIIVALENDRLRVEGQIAFSKYEGLEPVYTDVQRRPLCSRIHAVEQNRPGKDQRASRGRRAHSDAAQSEGGPAEAHPNQLTLGPARNSLAEPGAELRAAANDYRPRLAKPNVGRETYGAVPLPMKFMIRTMMKITMKM